MVRTKSHPAQGSPLAHPVHKKGRIPPHALVRSPSTGLCRYMKRKCTQLGTPSPTCRLQSNSASISYERRVALMLHCFASLLFSPIGAAKRRTVYRIFPLGTSENLLAKRKLDADVIRRHSMRIQCGINVTPQFLPLCLEISTRNKSQ